MNTLAKVREKKPLVLCLTNVVTMDLVANALLAIGASPIMSEAKEELPDLLALVQALYINIGTLHPTFIEHIHIAIKICQELKKPIIFDPVGAGASQLRQEATKNIFPHANIIRGNASEILSLKTQANMHGVDSAHQSKDAVQHAQQIAQHYHNTIVISGAIDYIINKKETASLSVGDGIMPYVTGMGCALSAVIAAFHAVEPDAFLAAYEATEYYGHCGEKAAQFSQGPGSFKMQFMDFLFQCSQE